MKFFRSKIDDKQVEDLKDQILNGWIIDWSPKSNKSAGIKFEDLEYILNYWRNKFDWKKQETDLNSFTQHKTKINNKVIVENKKKFSRFVALKVLTNNRIIKNERNRN